MSNLFYNRYIPPVNVTTNKPGSDPISTRPPKRIKTKKPTVTEHAEQEDPQHRKLRLKYEKSKKPTKATAEAANGDSAHGGRGEVNESRVEVEISEGHGLVPIPQPPPAPNAPKVSVASALPDWIRYPTYVSPENTIEWPDTLVPLATAEALKRNGYRRAFPIQQALFNDLLSHSQSKHDGDICVSAATGSGKTLAYAVPLVENLRGKPARKLRGLVVVPTKEIVAQTKEVLELSACSSELKVGIAVGSRSLKEEQGLLVDKGQRYDIQAYQKERSRSVDELEDLMDWDFDALKAPVIEAPLLPGWVVDYISKVDILICTPGRLVEHLKSTKGFNLHFVQWMIIDEADRLLDDTFQQWVDTVLPHLEYLPPLDPLDEQLQQAFRVLRCREVRKILLSATMTRDVSKLTALKLKKPKLVVLNVDKDEAAPIQADIATDQRLYSIPPTLREIAITVDDTDSKPLYLLKLLQDGLQPPGPSHNSSGEKSASLTNGTELNSMTLLPKIGGISTDIASGTSTPSTASKSDSSSRSLLPAHDIEPATRGTLVFTSSTSTTTRLAYLISKLDASISSYVHAFTKYTSRKNRKKALSLFTKPDMSNRPKYLPLIITTDLLRHGIDIPSLHQVINYSVPSSVEDYVHRVGRTARADLPGIAITLLENQQARWFWNEIARSPSLSRRLKVGRGKLNMKEWDNGKREQYQEALAQLGEAATGE